jgi:hypothetical protein
MTMKQHLSHEGKSKSFDHIIIEMNTSQSRSNRWNRRRSLDGMTMPASLEVENNDVNVNSMSHRQKQHEHPQSCRATTTTPIIRHQDSGLYGVMKPFILQPSSIVITKEFKDRIVASALASITTFVTLSLLMFTGQGRGYTCMRSPMLFVHSIAFHCTPHHNTSPFSSIMIFHSLVSLLSRISYRWHGLEM